MKAWQQTFSRKSTDLSDDINDGSVPFKCHDGEKVSIKQGPGGTERAEWNTATVDVNNNIDHRDRPSQDPR